MKYTRANIIGDAGEHLVAAKIIKLFGFACRLISIDLGIDAEIEIINNEEKSTGEFLKCQIKTTLKEDYHVYIQEKHLIYWNSVNIPVIVFLVHLKSEKIFWHCIKDLSQYEKSGSSIKLLFEKSSRFKKNNKQQFVELVHFKSFEEIRRIYEDAYEIAYQDKTELLDTGEYDLTTVEFFVANLVKIEYEFSKVKKMQLRNKSLEKIDIEFRDKLKLIFDYINKVKEIKEIVESEEGPDYYNYLKSENFTWE